jgi:hypothetical protein
MLYFLHLSLYCIDGVLIMLVLFSIGFILNYILSKLLGHPKE